MNARAPIFTFDKPPIKSWSFSRLGDFEKCSWLAKLKIVDKLPEPERPLPPGKTEHANDRGTRIHTELELFVQDKGPFPKEAECFRAEIESIKTRYLSGTVSLEGEWGFDRDWKVCDYNDRKRVWLRVKLDASIMLLPEHLLVVDYKSGRKHGNEIKHGEQTILYGLSAAIRHPEVQTIDTELYYIDQDELTHESKPAARWLYHLKAFNNRGLKMTECTEFKPNPSKYTCQYCPYKNEGCEFAHREDAPVRRKGR